MIDRIRHAWKQPAGRMEEELPVPAGIIPHFLLKRKKKTAPVSQGPSSHAAHKNNIH
ncbi:hypothetical protein [Desmospora profundinema]|uniref:Uncharacterized protein n=1 Tax=Desmospora profundinema TaxID=1571184 RepID=A0ABU1IME3_9BACL|nr:hypothetical protein [Desmospora profundinema]MDR6225945.1 hypothetical protein [Desmospora profundinema]